MRNLLTIIATFFVFGNAGAQSTDRTKAFGCDFTAEELSQYPQKTDAPTVYLEIYKTTYPVNEKGKAVATTTLDTNGNPILEDLNTIFGTKTETYYNAQIIIRDDNGTIQERKEPTTVRGRGNSTWNIYDCNDDYLRKKPLRLKFPQKVSLLGEEHANAKSWTLLANHLDATLIRNAMANEVGQRLNLPFCPSYKFVDLVVRAKVNNEDKNTYLGTYQISDQVQVATDRINIDEKTGYFLEANSGKPSFLEEPYLQLSWGGGTMYCNIKSPDPEYTEGGDIIYENYNDIKNRLESILRQVSNQTYAINWNKYVDLNSAVNAFICEDITGNYDGVEANNYAYINNLDEKLFFGPVWDTDLAWGGLVNNTDMTEMHFWKDASNNGTTTQFGNVCRYEFNSDPYFVKALYERWQTVYNNGALISYLQNRVDYLSNLIKNSAELNYSRVANGGAGETVNKSSWIDANVYKWGDAEKDPYVIMKQFIDQHLKWLDNEYKTKYELLNCASLTSIPETGFFYNCQNQSNGNIYSFIPQKSSDIRVGAKLTIEITNGRIESNKTPLQINNSSIKYERTLSSEDVTAIHNYDNSISFIVYEGTCTNVTLVPPPCETHNYTAYFAQSDGTYRLGCSVCSELNPETENTPYYQFSVYTDEASITTPAIVYATSWTPSAGNNIATVEIEPGLEGNITGYNIVNIKKDTAGNKVCKDFRLVDNAPYYSADKFFAENATYTRTGVTAGAWGTIVLPFGYTGAQNNDATFYRINSLSSENNTTTLMLDEATSVAENEPVLFKMAEGKTSFTINATNVEVKKSTAKKEGTYVGEWRLMGSVVPLTIDVTAEPYSSKNLYYISKNKFWHAKTTVTVNPFRAYIEGAAIPTTSNAIQLRIINGDITRIENVENTIFLENASSYYTLDGRRLHGKPTEKGIYIFNGRKEVIR